MRSIVAISGIGLSITVGIVTSAATANAADDASPSPASGAQSAATAQPPTAGEKPQAPSESDNHPAPNSVFVEGLGAGLIYSLNYERMVTDDVAVRGGFGYVSFGGSTSVNGQTTSSGSVSLLTIPITVSYTGIRARSSSLELGGGTTIAYASGSGSGAGVSASGSGVMPFAVAMVGYRLHPVDHAGFQLRVGAMAIAGEGLGLSNPNANSFGVIPWAYLSLGASF